MLYSSILSVPYLCPIRWVPWVRRPAVVPYVRAKAPILLEFFPGFVALPAQALQLAKPELIPVTLVRLDMVRDCGRHDQTLLQTTHAKRMQPHLMLLLDPPFIQIVPVARLSLIHI